MRELHEILMKGVRGGRERPGQFRDRQNYIAKEGGTIQQARFVPPPVAEMEQGLDDLEKYMHRPPTDESS
jgi:Fic family protein